MTTTTNPTEPEQPEDAASSGWPFGLPLVDQTRATLTDWGTEDGAHAASGLIMAAASTSPAASDAAVTAPEVTGEAEAVEDPSTDDSLTNAVEEQDQAADTERPVAAEHDDAAGDEAWDEGDTATDAAATDDAVDADAVPDADAAALQDHAVESGDDERSDVDAPLVGLGAGGLAASVALAAAATQDDDSVDGTEGADIAEGDAEVDSGDPVDPAEPVDSVDAQEEAVAEEDAAPVEDEAIVDAPSAADEDQDAFAVPDYRATEEAAAAWDAERAESESHATDNFVVPDHHPADMQRDEDFAAPDTMRLDVVEDVDDLEGLPVDTYGDDVEDAPADDAEPAVSAVDDEPVATDLEESADTDTAVDGDSDADASADTTALGGIAAAGVSTAALGAGVASAYRRTGRVAPQRIEAQDSEPTAAHDAATGGAPTAYSDARGELASQTAENYPPTDSADYTEDTMTSNNYSSNDTQVFGATGNQNYGSSFDQNYDPAVAAPAPYDSETELVTAEDVVRAGKRGTIDFGLLIMRIGLGGVLLAHGLMHFLGGAGIAGFESELTAAGLSGGNWLAIALAGTEIGAGALILLGLATPFAAALGLVVAVTSLLVGLTGVTGWGEIFGGNNAVEAALLLAGGVFALQFTGPGKLALDFSRGWARRPLASSWIFGVVGIGGAVALWILLGGGNPVAGLI